MGPLSTFFVGAGIGAVGEIGFWLGTRAGTRPAPTGAFEGEGGDGEVGGRGQAQGLPLRGRLRGKRRGWGRRRGQGLRLRGFDGAGGGGWRSSFGWALGQYRHQVDEGCCRRGGVAGAEPPHKGGPNRPDRPKARREWRGERREKNLRSAREGSRIDGGGVVGWGVGEWRADWGWVRWGKCV